jgi:hypothetical protein
MAQEHQKKINEILINQPENVRLFQSRAGQAWQGEVIRKGKFIIIKNPVPFYAMPDGFPDITGWTETEITPDMVGQRVAIFTGVEVKTGKQGLKKDQRKFREIILRMGGIYRIIR